MKKILNFISKYKLYLLTFLASTIVISIIYILNSVTPFGGKSLLCVDFFHQYGPMLGELYDRIHHGKSLLYSFSMGLGLPFFRNFLNYMSSPFNIIILFFSKSNLLTSYSFVIGLKAIIASCTIVFFLSHKFKTKSLVLIPLGVLYAFSAYFSAYYWNIMWLDGMVFLPLITLGIEYIVNEHKWKFYSIWLAVMLISNYFIGYMICIFSVLYFIIYSIYKLNLQKDKRKESIKHIFKGFLVFAGASILSGMLAAIFLIPMYFSLKSISATGDAWPVSQYYKFTLEDYLKYHFTGVSTTVFGSDPINAPNISAGILSIGLFFLFILNKNISIKTKICYLILLAFFILAFFWAPLDYILSAFHVPNDLPYRYSFIYTFIIIIICAYSILNIKKNLIKNVLIVYLSLILILIIMLKSNWVGLDQTMIFINIIILTISLVCYLIYHFKEKMKIVGIIILSVTACTDVIISINHNWDITQIKDVFYQDYDSTKELLNYVENLKNDEFYRIDNTNTLTFNDSSWYNYYGMTAFSSMAYESMAKLQHNLGMAGNLINSYHYAHTTPIYDLMFDINYFIGTPNDYKRYVSTRTTNQTVNTFIYNIGLGFGVNNNLKLWMYTNSNPFEVQNDFIYKSSGISDVLIKLKPLNLEEIICNDNECIINFVFENVKDNLYFYTDDYSINYFTIGNVLYYKNDTYSDTENINKKISYLQTSTYTEPNIINISSSEDTIDIKISFNPYNYNYIQDAFQVYTIDHFKFIDAYNILKNNKLNITSFKEDTIEANITLDASMFVYTSIPYDEGWQVYVDGKKVKTFKIGNALLAFDADKGYHTIKFKYIPKGLLLGMICSLVGISIMITNIVLDNKKRNSK